MRPERFQTIYEDNDVIVVKKPAGIPTQTKQFGAQDMVSLIKNHIAKTNSGKGEPYLAVIHRLDQPVEGLLVFGKTPLAARELNRQLTSQGFGKHYRAFVSGVPSEGENKAAVSLVDFLLKDGKTNTSSVVKAGTKDAKEARLTYQKVTENFYYKEEMARYQNEACAELDITLDTGRHHQIRVQLSHANLPIVGDRKYGDEAGTFARNPRLCLCSYRLKFTHPTTKKALEFSLI